jgi:hypothetical protein
VLKNIWIVSAYSHDAQGVKVSEITITVACIFAGGNAFKFTNVNNIPVNVH